jgi:uncharacterized protein YigE (DUF2233 family)
MFFAIMFGEIQKYNFRYTNFYVGLFILLTLFVVWVMTEKENNIKTNLVNDEQFISFTVDPHKQKLKFYWRNEQNQPFKSILQLKSWLKTKNNILIFATNGGMYEAGNIPKGLFIENKKLIKPLDTVLNGTGNFYLQPNGIFYITDSNDVKISSTKDFLHHHNINFATQSGPMLLINGKIHPAFQKNSLNLNIRNGVGILPNNRVVFVMSKKEINFFDFANYFKEMGCKDALYLDGFVSRTYLPTANWKQTDGNFAVMIGVTKH